MTLLETKKATKAYGALIAVSKVDFQIEPGKIHSIIGPNGAGKTTFFNLLAGVYPPTSGQIIFEGQDISSLKMDRRSRLGIGRSYQVTSIFPELTVRENVRLAVQSRSHHNFSFFRHTHSLPELIEKADAILEQMGIHDLADKTASTIPYGSQRSLDVAIALATEPKLLLLDEPTSGMSPDDTVKMISLIERISERYTIALIEHHMSVVMSISDIVTVLSQGMVIAEGSPEDIQQNDDVKQAYLGGGKF
jgi:ABC-type branched-subunit amino acid transport system ATPase component